MKRVPFLIIFILCGGGAVYYGLMRLHAARHPRANMYLMKQVAIVLDATSKSILAGADRVETFRLGDFHEEENFTPAEMAILSNNHVATLDDHSVLQMGAPQGKVFATQLSAAVSQLKDPGFYAQCFDPGVGFRVWKGKAHMDICVCFYCSGVEIITKDPHHKVVFQKMTDFGGARSAFLALSRQAFLHDPALLAVKDQ